MSPNGNLSPEVAAPGIRILKMNTDKTRKHLGSDDLYHVYFELSASPSPEWRIIFDQEWSSLQNPRKASLDERYLVVHCPLDEIAVTQLPALTKAVSLTNRSYHETMQHTADARHHQQDAWKQERAVVESVASSLAFDPPSDPHWIS